MGTKRDSVRVAQRILGVADDGRWGPVTDAAFNTASLKDQTKVQMALGAAGISVTEIRGYKKAGGDSYKKAFTDYVVPAVLREARARGMNGPIMVAQLKLESGGGGRIPIDSYNWGGIKARPGEPAVLAMTNEFIGGRMERVKQPFRKYANPEEFASDYVGRLAQSKRYAKAYRQMDNQAAAIEIAQAGYATDPAYARKLSSTAEALFG